jgi:hypothetical protein
MFVLKVGRANELCLAIYRHETFQARRKHGIRVTRIQTLGLAEFLRGPDSTLNARTRRQDHDGALHFTVLATHPFKYLEDLY